MSRQPNKLPKFKSEDEEREFWATHSSEGFFDWERALVNPVLPNLKPSNETISLRLPKSLLARIKMEAHRRGVPYQSLMKSKLYEVFIAS